RGTLRRDLRDDGRSGLRARGGLLPDSFPGGERDQQPGRGSGPVSVANRYSGAGSRRSRSPDGRGVAAHLSHLQTRRLHVTQLDLGFSPCPNDTFIFHALVHGMVDADGLSFRPRLEDVETLNRLALTGS